MTATSATARPAPATILSAMRGFTLIEIMVVVVIIGLLASVVAFNVMPKLGEARVAKARQDIAAYSSALDFYKIDNAKYPTTDQGLAALVNQPSDARNWPEGGYIKGGLKKDPWGNEYHYQYPGSHGPYDLFTYGADNQEGGEKENADIGSWNLQ